MKGGVLLRWMHMLVALLSLVILLLANGCDGGTGLREGGIELLNQAKESLKSAKSYSMKGKIELAYTIPDQPLGSLDVSIPVEAEVEQDGKTPRVRALYDFSDFAGMPGFPLTESSPSGSGEGSEQTMEMYLIDRVFYFRELDGRWRYLEFDLPATPMNINQILTPQAIAMLLDYPDEVDLEQEDNSHARYRLLLGEVYRQALSERIQASSTSPNYGELSSYLEKSLEMIAQLKMELWLTVLKTEASVSRMELVLSGSQLPGMGQENTQFEMRMSLDFSDYGKDFSIMLPSEAGGAQKVVLEQATSTP